MAKLETNLKFRSDVLEEGVGLHNREAIVRSMVTTARQRRRRAGFVRTISVAGIGCLAFLHLSYRSTKVEPGVAAPVVVTRSEAPRFTIVENGDLPVVPLLTSHSGSVTILTTRSSTPDLREVSERELMQMLDGWSVALVKHPDGTSELTVFQAAAQ
jgi:hypothetical protein